MILSVFLIIVSTAGGKVYASESVDQTSTEQSEQTPEEIQLPETEETQEAEQDQLSEAVPETEAVQENVTDIEPEAGQEEAAEPEIEPETDVEPEEGSEAETENEQNAEAVSEETAEDNSVNDDGFTGPFMVVSDSAQNYSYEEGCLHIYGGTVILRMLPEIESTSDRIEIAGDAVLVLAGVRIEAEQGAALSVLPGVSAQIKLAVSSDLENNEEEPADEEIITDNYLTGAEGFAGIEVCAREEDAEDAEALNGCLQITGSGTLFCTGGAGGAGIGGSRSQNGCGIIRIEEGNITVIAGEGADGIGCGAESSASPAANPVISENVNSILVFYDGTTSAIACTEAGQTEDTVESANACLLCAAFMPVEDNSLAGLEDVRIKATNGDSALKIDLPEGYRGFAVQTQSGLSYMIEQGGRVFAGTDSEDPETRITEGEDAQVVFTGNTTYDAEEIRLVPVEKAPAINVAVKVEWKDEDDQDGSRPDQVTVTLYGNGNETGRVLTISEGDEWEGTFEDMSVYSDSVRQSYSVVEDKVSGYTVAVQGSDTEGYTITNIHEPLPEGRSSEEEIRKKAEAPAAKGKVVATVITTKVSRTTPARTSTTIKKTMSAKTSDTNDTLKWGIVLLAAAAALFIWMRFEEKHD